MKAKKSKARQTGEQATKVITDSAQQIWLAGLGAFAKAQAEGTRVFDTLVEEGEQFQARTRDRVDAQMEKAGKQVDKVKARASGNWDKLEQVFEERVARALGRLGVPTREDIQALAAQIEALRESVDALAANGSKPAPARRRTKAVDEAA